jgi:hypothetical protein
MTVEKQAEKIAAACKETGLDGHIKWIDSRKQANTWAEKIAERFRNRRQLPVKNSYMFCDTLDMCFFYSKEGQPIVTYAGYATPDSPDINCGKLAEAFGKAEQVLNAMRKLAEEEKA